MTTPTWRLYFAHLKKRYPNLRAFVWEMVKSKTDASLLKASRRARREILVLCDWRRVLRLVLVTRALRVSARPWSPFCVESLIDKHRACEHLSDHGDDKKVSYFWKSVVAMEKTIAANREHWEDAKIHDFTFEDMDIVDALVHSNNSTDVHAFSLWRLSPDLSGRLQRAVLSVEDSDIKTTTTRQTLDHIDTTLLRPPEKRGSHVVFQSVNSFGLSSRVDEAVLFQTQEDPPNRQKVAIQLGKEIVKTLSTTRLA